MRHSLDKCGFRLQGDAAATISTSASDSKGERGTLGDSSAGAGGEPQSPASRRLELLAEAQLECECVELLLRVMQVGVCGRMEARSAHTIAPHKFEMRYAGTELRRCPGAD